MSTLDMFGLLLSGRLVDTSFRQVDPTHVVIDIAQADSFNHVVVFLTGQQAFPDAMGGAVYFAWPNTPPSLALVEQQQHWQYLGNITNTKPSAIFKVNKMRRRRDDDDAASAAGCGAWQQQQDDLVHRFGGHHLNRNNGAVPAAAPSPHAQLGISVEPLAQLDGLTPDAQAEAASLLPTFVDFSQKMVKNLFNYTSSFAVSPAETAAAAKPGETYVPFTAVQQWYANFERRLQQNPYFWRS